MESETLLEHRPERPPPSFVQPLRLWFGISDRVTRAAYIVSGFGLMFFKYAVEATVIAVFTGAVFWPWDFLNPALNSRTDLLRGAPEWLAWALFLWTLPFLWIAVSMSVRRAIDAGRSPWLGLWLLVPLVNLVLMFTLAVQPSIARSIVPPTQPSRTKSERWRSIVPALGLSQLIGGLMFFASIYLFNSYGASLFMGTPLLMGASAGYFYNRDERRTRWSSIGIGALSVVVAMLCLLLFALEGVMCIAMAAPLLLPIGAFGGLIGKAIADATQNPRREFAAAIVALPIMALGESVVFRARETVVLSSVEIDAPPEKVWQNVVSFPELPKERPWYFSLGIACPERARIEGAGVGAIRYCEFSTGAFVEPITVWDEPRSLAFDVTKQPDPLVELSPYPHVHPPHLHGHLRSTHGEFRLIAMPENRTRLEGRTWYRIEMHPQWYWTLWSDALIHRIHERVLGHIKTLSES